MVGHTEPHDPALYPFDVVERSTALLAGREFVLADVDAHDVWQSGSLVDGERLTIRDLAARRGVALPTRTVTVLAYGSNAAPGRLRQKLASVPTAVALVEARLHDLDVVHAAHVTSYGAVPGTLAGSPGTTVRAFVLHLDADLLPRLHRTESLGANYAFVRLRDIRLTVGNRTVEAIDTYLALSGVLAPDGDPIAVAGFDRTDGRFRVLPQGTVLDMVRVLTAPDADRVTFCRDLVAHEPARSDARERLEPHTLMSEPPHVVLLGG